MDSSNLKNVPLFAFATAMEFSKVFPEEAQSCAGALDGLNKLIPLGGKFQNAYACIVGVGILDFSVGLSQVLLDLKQNNVNVSAVFNLGICGAFPDSGLSVLDVVRVASDCVGDLGYENSDGSFSPWMKCFKEASLDKIAKQDFDFICNLKAVKGITVNCCTGTQATSQKRAQQFGCHVESMEGAACFAVCESFGVPAFQIRAVSNFATTRDKTKWKIDEALKKLAELFN